MQIYHHTDRERSESAGLDWLCLYWRIISTDWNIERAAGVLPQVHRGLGLLAPVAGVEIVTI